MQTRKDSEINISITISMNYLLKRQDLEFKELSL